MQFRNQQPTLNAIEKLPRNNVKGFLAVGCHENIRNHYKGNDSFPYLVVLKILSNQTVI